MFSSETILNHRFKILIFILGLILVSSSGAQFLYFDNDYRTFFGKDNPQLKAFEQLQKTYTKIDNINFAIDPKLEKSNNLNVLSAVEKLTEKSWQIPFSIRVDSLSNFQYTEVEGDDLIVRDLYENAQKLTEKEKKLVDLISVSDPIISGKLHDKKHRSTSVNVTLQLPGKSPDEIVLVAEEARKIASEIEEEFNIKIRLGGIVFLNNAFLEASMKDMSTLIPIMYLIILIICYLLLRSIYATFFVLLVIIPSITIAMGLAGWMGVGLTPPSASAPQIITTLAVADSIHILVVMFNKMREGLSQRESLLYSMRVNAKPVFLTSVTTALGFLSLNFSDSPPFHDLGNITAIGVMAAWVNSMVLLPILISFVSLKPKGTLQRLDKFMELSGKFISEKYKKVLFVSSFISIIFVLFVPFNELNDDFVKYFDKSVEYRQDADWINENLTGVNQVQFNLSSGNSNGVSNPEFLKKIEKFANWSRSESDVLHVQSISDIFKRLNRDLNGGDQNFYKIPENRELAAQYLLLYELSLPFGLDLNNQLDINKSSTQVIVTLRDMTTVEMRSWIKKAEKYLSNEIGLESMAIGPVVMFAYISERNIKSMLYGTLFSVFMISGIILIALRNIKIGILSLIPNILPAAIAFGLWGIFVGQINLGVSVVVGMVLGVVVDDTVHFLSKYQIARNELNLTSKKSIVFAFSGVGTALLVTTLILVMGFMILAQSTFGVNSSMALLTAIALVIALVADLTLLPGLLITIDKDKKK